ncbi:MAG: PEP-CTERM sorting domain-containing protein [Pseudomonadota bacterium]
MNLTKPFKQLAAAAVCALALFSISAHAVPAFDVDPYSTVDYDASNYNFAIDFTANQALTVDALAYFFNAADVTGSHAVALFDMSGNKLAETIVDTSDTLLGNFRYSSIGAVNLLAGMSYRIIGLSNGELYGLSANSVAVNPGIHFIQSGYSGDSNSLTPEFAAAFTFGAQNDPADSIWGPSLSVNPTQVQVPEPATYALLFAGLGLLLISHRRKSS